MKEKTEKILMNTKETEIEVKNRKGTRIREEETNLCKGISNYSNALSPLVLQSRYLLKDLS